MQQGGSQYGVSPEMTPFAGTGGGTRMLGGVSGGTDHLQKQEQKKLGDAMLTAEAAAPINSRPPAVAVPRSTGNFEELEPESGGFPDEDVLAGEEVERGVTGGNRWPRQETVALLKIRSEMDVAFRDATLKGPLWEDVSRKLAELGYVRSAKKCKEKFENVHKYYKRTKEARAGRQDGKSYRFFSQLEALHTSSSSTTATTPTPIATTATNSAAVAPVSIGIGSSNAVPNSSGRIQPPTVSATPAAATNQIGIPQISPSTDLRTSMAPATGISGSATATTFSFSSNTSSSADSDLEGGVTFSTDSRKRKRGSSRGGSSTRRKMMSFFEGLMKQVMERQEAMQQRFLEAIEKREQDRMIREEAWKRQEMARLSREHEITAQERAISASRDSAIISFLQKITGQTIQLPQPINILAAPLPQSTTPTPPPPAPQPQQRKQQLQQQQPPPQQHHHHHHQSQNSEIMRHHPASSEVVVAVPEHKQQQQLVPQEMSSGGGSFDPTSSRWPKAEVHALIKLRSGLESRYQEAGPKGPLWEEISAGMQRMGYNRSAKRCKEKWENINKYFKKVKESNKKRPEDAKTCPYFHQLEALHRKKILGGGGGSFGNQNSRQQQLQATMDPNPTTTKLADKSDVLAIMPPPPPMHISETENNNNKNGENTEVQTNNGGLPSSLLEEGNRGAGGTGAATAVEKPEDIVTKLMEQQQQQSVMDDYDKMEEADSDNLDQEEDDEEDDDDDDEDEDTEEESKMAYKIQFQRQNAGSSNGGGNAAGSFLAIVQ